MNPLTYKQRIVKETQFLTKQEENNVKSVLNSLAQNYNLLSSITDVYQREKSLYLDLLWYVKIGEDEIPVVAFEIEKGIPTNERLRKDIMNLVSSKAPRGYIILPHNRIKRAFNPNINQPWVNWYHNNFSKVFENYYLLFRSFIDIKLVDADEVLKNRALKEII